MREIKTIEKYRERLIEAFHNAGYDELIAYVVLPFEEEFTTLEEILKCWKKHSFYPSAGKESSETTPEYDEGLIDGLDICISFLSTLTPTYPKKGKWIRTEEKYLVDENDDGAVYEYRTTWTCSQCGYKRRMRSKPDDKFCKECGADMRESE